MVEALSDVNMIKPIQARIVPAGIEMINQGQNCLYQGVTVIKIILKFKHILSVRYVRKKRVKKASKEALSIK
jgi:hypothetical protein